MSLACVEVGGSSVETLLFGDDGTHVRRSGAVVPAEFTALVAVPGLVAGGRVVAASNLGWYDVNPLRELGLDADAALVLNDAEAAALGEVVLRDVTDAVYVGLGTGVGGAVVVGRRVVAENLFGHLGGFSEVACPCGRVGCLETVAGGWALATPIEAREQETMAAAVAGAITREPAATPELVVIAGGIARAYPSLVEAIARNLPDRIVEPSAAPRDVKSAAAWGLRLAHAQREPDPVR